MAIVRNGPDDRGTGTERVLLQMLERDRAAVATALRAETAQVLATLLITLAALDECDDIHEVRAGLRELRETVRADLERVQTDLLRLAASPAVRKLLSPGEADEQRAAAIRLAEQLCNSRREYQQIDFLRTDAANAVAAQFARAAAEPNPAGGPGRDAFSLVADRDRTCYGNNFRLRGDGKTWACFPPMPCGDGLNNHVCRF